MTNQILIKEINMQNDCMFKAVMCSPNNREMVVDVLHAFTKIEKKLLYNATYIGGEEIVKKNMVQKRQSVDMTIKIQSNQQIIVEMNQHSATSIFEKNTLYSFSKIVENTRSSKKIEYPKIILININNFNRFQTDQAILEFKLRDKEGNIETEFYESIHFVIANVKKSSYNVDNELKKFSNFLKKKTTLGELEREFKGDEKYMAAIRTVKELATDPEFSGYYDVE